MWSSLLKMSYPLSYQLNSKHGRNVHIMGASSVLQVNWKHVFHNLPTWLHNCEGKTQTKYFQHSTHTANKILRAGRWKIKHSGK